MILVRRALVSNNKSRVRSGVWYEEKKKRIRHGTGIDLVLIAETPPTIASTSGVRALTTTAAWDDGHRGDSFNKLKQSSEANGRLYVLSVLEFLRHRALRVCWFSLVIRRWRWSEISNGTGGKRSHRPAIQRYSEVKSGDHTTKLSDSMVEQNRRALPVISEPQERLPAVFIWLSRQKTRWRRDGASDWTIWGGWQEVWTKVQNDMVQRGCARSIQI